MKARYQIWLIERKRTRRMTRKAGYQVCLIDRQGEDIAGLGVFKTIEHARVVANSRWRWSWTNPGGGRYDGYRIFDLARRRLEVRRFGE